MGWCAAKNGERVRWGGVGWGGGCAKVHCNMSCNASSMSDMGGMLTAADLQRVLHNAVHRDMTGLGKQSR